MKLIRNFPLVFHPASEEPIEAGDYVLFNQCDGFHLAELILTDNGKPDGFAFAADGSYVLRRFYQAWAKLPDTSTLYACFRSGHETE